MDDSTRRRFLRVSGIVGTVGLAGCSQLQGGSDIQDTDGDGVIDSEDYAPRDASVQDAEDVEEVGSTEQDVGDEDQSTERPTEDPSNDTPTERDENTMSIYDDFENGNLRNPRWRAVGGGPGGLAPANEIGIVNEGHASQYSLRLDQGGSISNFGAETILNKTISPTRISFWIEPTSADRFTKNQFRFIYDDNVGIRFNNHIENDGLYFRFGDGNDEQDRERVRDGAIRPNIGRFVEIRMEQIDWSTGNIGEVYADNELVTQNAPFENTVPGFDTLNIFAVGGGGTVFRVDDIRLQ